MCTSPVECWSVRLVVHVCLQNQTGRCCPSKWMILSSWIFHWIVYWSGNKSREWVLEATESQPPIEGQEGLWFMVLLSKRFMLAIYHIYVDIYICTYQTKVALLFFRLFFYQVVPLSKDSKPFFCFQQIYVVYFARLRLWNERWKWFIRSQVVLQSVFIFRWNTRNPNQMRLERNCGWWKLMTYEFGSTNLSKKVLLSVKGSTKF